MGKEEDGGSGDGKNDENDDDDDDEENVIVPSASDVDRDGRGRYEELLCAKAGTKIRPKFVRIIWRGRKSYC